MLGLIIFRGKLRHREKFLKEQVNFDSEIVYNDLFSEKGGKSI